jgi:hypothetical protein
LNFSSIFRVKHNDLSDAATHKQTMMGFVESYCEAALLRQRNRPTCRDGAALPVDHFDLVLGYVIRIDL